MEEENKGITPEVIINDSVDLNEAPYTLQELSREVFGMISEKTEKEIYSQPNSENPGIIEGINTSGFTLNKWYDTPLAVYIDGEGGDPEEMTLYIVVDDYSNNIIFEGELSGSLYYAHVGTWGSGGVVGIAGVDEFIVGHVVFTDSTEKAQGRELHINNSDLGGGNTLETEIISIDWEDKKEINNMDSPTYQGHPSFLYTKGVNRGDVYIVDPNETPRMYEGMPEIKYYQDNSIRMVYSSERIHILNSDESIPEEATKVNLHPYTKVFVWGFRG